MEQDTSSLIKTFFYLKNIFNKKECFIIPFKNDKIKIGRAKDSDFLILDPSISRCHAIFEKQNDKWFVINMSTNGVYLNNELVPQGKEMQIEIGHIIKLGQLEEFTFRFSLKEKRLQSQSDSDPIRNKACTSESPDLHTTFDGQLSNNDSKVSVSLSNNEQMLINLQQEKDQLEEKNKKEQKELERRVQEGEIAQKNVLHEKEMLAQKLKSEVSDLQYRLQSEKASRLEDRLRIEEENKAKILKEKEELSLKLDREKLEFEQEQIAERTHLEQELASLREARTNLEKDLQICQERKLEEADHLNREKEGLEVLLKQVEESLEEKVLLTSTLAGELMDKEKAEERLAQVEREKEALKRKLVQANGSEAELTELRKSLANLRYQKDAYALELEAACAAVEAKNRVVEEVPDVVESEFQCAICSELFVTALMLNCGHTFCKLCIHNWKKTKRECPICRMAITAETRSVVIDSFIDKIVETLSDYLKEQRRMLVEDRTAAANAEKVAEEAEQAQRAAAAASRSRRGRGRRNNRGRYNNRAQQAQPLPPPPLPPPPPSSIVVPVSTTIAIATASSASSSNMAAITAVASALAEALTAHNVPRIRTRSRTLAENHTDNTEQSERESNQEPITLSSDSESQSDLDGNSDMSGSGSSPEVSGDEGVFFGGYGRYGMWLSRPLV